jgi:hypothetical protein
MEVSMKLRIALIAVLMALVIAPNLKSAPKYSSAITADPFGLVWGQLNATYEFQTSPENSITIFGSYWGYADWSAFGFGGSYRWYLGFIKDGKKIIEGFSFGPRAELGFWTWNGSYYNYDGGMTVAIGGEAGYKWIWGGFVLEPNFRLMFPVSKVTGLSYTGYGFGVNVGFAW